MSSKKTTSAKVREDAMSRKLIAAAPELLAIIEDVVAVLGDELKHAPKLTARIDAVLMGIETLRRRNVL